MSLRNDAEIIIRGAIKQVLPDEAVANAINKKISDGGFGQGKIIAVSVGKAGWQMAKAAYDILGNRIDAGVCVTKYGHVLAEIPHFTCIEAGHPLPDKNSFRGTEEAIKLVADLSEEDTVILLLSGGGSALFEKALVDEEELAEITSELLGSGADIIEINTIRKRLSAVKGGKFAKICEPAHVFSVVLSDIIGDPLDMIASGPAYPDSSSSEEALKIIEKYNLKVSDKIKELMTIETPKYLSNVETVITGSVKNLCTAAAGICETLGYESIILTDELTCTAKEAGLFMASIAKTHARSKSGSKAFIAGGETVVRITGDGKGGRNQELALAAAEGISSLDNVCVFSVGSDGTDGPTDAAGGYVDGNTADLLKSKGINIYDVLKENDSYNALNKTGGLIITGPTGTNVNDFAVVLIK